MASNGNSVPVHTKGATVPFFINGQEIVAPKTFGVVNPATHAIVHQCSSATEDDAQAAVDAAAAALPAWKALPPSKRRDVFLKAAEVMDRRKEELATTMVEEVGAAQGWADFNVMMAREFLLDLAGRLVAVDGFIPTVSDPATGAMVIKEPYGVVLAIAPW